MIADLVLVRGTDWISHAIEDVEHSPYSHVAGYSLDGRLIEAQGGRKVGYQDSNAYAGKSDTYTCPVLTDLQRRLIVNYVKRQIGKRYSYLLIVWELIRYVFNIFLPTPNKWQPLDCSVLWVDAYRSIGVDLCPGIKYPSPADVANSPLLKKL